MKDDMKQKQRKSMIRDYILLGIVIIIAAIMLLFFPDRLDTVANESRVYFTEMMMILPAVIVIMGFFTVWISKDTIRKYLGKASGIKGIFLSIIFGALPTGPLYVAFPMAATFLKKGASISNVIVFLSAWACIKIPQEMVELQFLGLNFMASRLILTIVFVSLMGVAIEYMIERSNKKVIESKR
jgi:uncharacterized membrane protein YraQ (UPF0718 family)